MNILSVKKFLFFTTVGFFTVSFCFVSTLQAKENSTVSFYTGDAGIKLNWNHPFSSPKAIAFTKVDTKAEIFESGVAIADAAASSSLILGDTGEVEMTVFIDGGAIGIKALANSTATAQSFFLLRNTSENYVTVNFNWSAEWLINGAIGMSEMGRSEALVHFSLAKRRINYRNKSAVNDKVLQMKEQMKKRRANRWYRRKGKNQIFTKFLAVRLPLNGAQFYDSNMTGDKFEITFRPKQSYLFGLSAEATGLATASLEGCPGRFWKQHRKLWPIDPGTAINDIFDLEMESETLWAALTARESNEEEVERIRNYEGEDGELELSSNQDRSIENDGFPENREFDEETEGFMRNAVVALLNIASSRLSYNIGDVGALVSLVRRTIESGSLDDMALASDDLEYHNNLGAPYICSSALL